MTVITPGVAPGSAARREPPAPVLVAALASAGAGLIHAAAAGVHAEHRSMAWLFAACAVVQLGWAVLVVARPARLLLVAGALFQVACVGVWALSRTAGWPVVESMRDGEAAGYPDSAAAAMAAVAAAAAGVAVLRPAARRAGLPLLALGSVVVLALAMPAMAAPHDHLVDEHADTHADDLVLDTVGEDAAAPGDGWGHDHGDPVGGADGPIVSLDDPRLSPEQRERAGSLIDVTTAAMAAFPDQAAVEAAGYRSIGDGGTGHEHFVRWDLLNDGRELDPDAIESIVLTVHPDGTKQVSSAMYILDTGRTMADVPDIAGELTTWHDHQNLCWEGGRVVGVLRDGRCPRGDFRPTPPMIHVWIVPNECGPFAGLVGFGEPCDHQHRP